MPASSKTLRVFTGLTLATLFVSRAAGQPLHPVRPDRRIFRGRALPAVGVTTPSPGGHSLGSSTCPLSLTDHGRKQLHMRRACTLSSCRLPNSTSSGL